MVRSKLYVGENGRLINPEEELQYSNFLGVHLSKASRERAKERRDERHAARLERIEARTAPKLALAQQGIVAPSGFAQAFSAVGNLAASLTGHPATDAINDQVNQSIGQQGLSAQQQVQANIADQYKYSEGESMSPVSKKNLPYFIGGVLLFVILIVVLLKKK